MKILVAFFVFVLLFFIVKRQLFYQKLIQECMDEKNYSDALLHARTIGSWWMISYLSDRIEKNFLEMNSDQAVRSINALMEVGDRKRARRILFNQGKKRKDYKTLFAWHWKDVNC
jgi:hypothetical protein